MANPLALVSGLLAVTCFLLALFILRVGRLWLHRLWACFNISVGIWGTGICLAALSKSQENAFRFWQFAHAGGFFVGVFFYHVVHNFCELKSKKFLFFAYVQAIFFSVLNLVGITGYEAVPTFGPLYYIKVHNFLYIAVTILWFLPVIYGHAILLKALHSATGKKRIQIKYLLVSMFIGFSGGVQHFLPVYDINVYPYGNLLITLYTLIATFAIFKHKLLDIEVIIKKTLVFAGIVTAAVSTIALPLAIFQAVIGKAFGVPHPFVLMALGIATTVLIYRPVERFLVNITDKYLFQKKINYRLLLREASEYLAHVDSLKQQSRNIVAFLLKKARIANASVYAFAAPDRSALVMKASRPVIKDENLKRITLSHPIIEHFYRRQEPIELHSLKDSCDNGVLRLEDYNEIATLMKSVRAEAAIPCYGGEANSKFDKKSSRLKGVLFLGHQKSDEAYSEEELDVFFTLGQESSIAFENARLYDEAINRSIELAQINEELNKINKELKETQAALMEEKKRALLAGIGKSIAHEINNPLTPLAMNLYFVKGILDKMENLHQKCLVESGEKNRKEFSEALETAKRKLLEAEKGKERIKGIVQTLRDLVRKRTGEKKAVQLKIIVDSAIEEMKYQTYWETLSAPNIEVHIPMSLPFISGITHDLQGVFVNLIINALHAMENRAAGKQITIEADVDEESADMIKIKFSDNGCGIPKELQEKVFEHGFTTKGNQGTGIGLFYCKDNIERVHHGIMSVKSEAGVGTCFTIKLPCYKKEVAS